MSRTLKAQRRRVASGDQTGQGRGSSDSVAGCTPHNRKARYIARPIVHRCQRNGNDAPHPSGSLPTAHGASGASFHRFLGSRARMLQRQHISEALFERTLVQLRDHGSLRFGRKRCKVEFDARTDVTKMWDVGAPGEELLLARDQAINVADEDIGGRPAQTYAGCETAPASIERRGTSGLLLRSVASEPFRADAHVPGSRVQTHRDDVPLRIAATAASFRYDTLAARATLRDTNEPSAKIF